MSINADIPAMKFSCGADCSDGECTEKGAKVGQSDVVSAVPVVAERIPRIASRTVSSFLLIRWTTETQKFSTVYSWSE